jgi:hypothetical protein
MISERTIIWHRMSLASKFLKGTHKNEEWNPDFRFSVFTEEESSNNSEWLEIIFGDENLNSAEIRLLLAFEVEYNVYRV